MLLRVGNGLAEDLLMSEMHAVKKSNRQANSATLGFQFARGMDDFHGSRRRRRQGESEAGPGLRFCRKRRAASFPISCLIISRFEDGQISFKNGITRFSRSLCGSASTCSN